MSRRQTSIAPLPQEWLAAVIPLLEEGDLHKILWTGRAEREMVAAGLDFKFQAHELCLQVLRTPGMLGEQVFGMVDERDGTVCEAWAFLCPHPLHLPTPLYAKIALHEGRLLIHMISLHTDHNGKLLAAIRRLHQKRP